MIWQYTHRADRTAAKIADRHYSRQKPGTDQFTPPGRVLVLVTPEYDAVWATSWPYPEYVNRAYKTAWVNSLFRNESGNLSSEMILRAIAATRWYFGEPPDEGMITLIDPRKVRPMKRRGQPHWGYCYERAGFMHVGETKEDKLLIFQLLPENMPAAAPPGRMQLNLFEMVT